MIKRFIAPLALICLFALPSLAATSSGCPTSTKNFFPAPNVAASFSNVGNTFTYTFTSLTNEKPFTNGVPGLIKYCVYPSPATNEPTTGNATATGADGSTWLFKKDPKEFAFVRPGGNKTDILLNGTSTTMGTATFGTPPTDQNILLHIADPTVCKQVYPNSTAGTCFVKPSPALSCNAGVGDSVAAYNAIPFGGVNCAPPSVGVEAYGFNELGDQVILAGTARQLVSLNVLFTSYGCSVGGHWYSGTTAPCVTTTGASFTIPITANIYDPSDLTTPIATTGPVDQTIPYRPSADPTNCPNGYPIGCTVGVDCTYEPKSQWFNQSGNGGAGACQYSIGKVLTFDFSSLNKTLPDNVIWTVAYNTSHSGYNPIADPLGPGAACETSPGGCGYDSLNVGIKSYPNAPYAGTDVDENVVFINWWKGNTVPQYPWPWGFGVLTPPVGVESTTDAIISGWFGYRPLGQIITK